jgi:hypothetical protein
MKLPIFILAVLSFAPACLEAQSTTQSQITVPAATPYIIVNQDANNRVWQREQYEASPNGEIVTNVQTYTELATGLNFEDTNGNWQASQEEIEQQSDGTEAATQGQNKVYFPANLLNGEIKMITPDGLALNSQPAVLSYYDGTNTAIIAVLTNSVGRIVGPNQVIYTNAFSGLTADVLLTYRKSGLEQDIIVRQQPPTPESFGLNAATARLQVLTEFFDPPQPQVTSCTLPNQAGLALTDQTLGFGLMEMGSGRAFLFGQSATDPGVLVAKSWVVLDGRHFLVEEVPVNAVVEGLAALPLTAINGGFGRAPHLASSHRVLPHNKMERKSASERMLAKGSLPLNGFVLDYQTINTSMSNYNFKCDSTYYVSGPVNLYQTSTFEGGTVVKFATNGSITISGFAQYINCQGGAYRPVVFTAVDDNSVGDSIGSGTPSGYYGNPMLSLGSSLPTPNLTGVRFCYAQTAIRGLFVGANIYDAQFVNCQNGLSIGGAQFVVGNALFANTLTNIIFAQDGNASANIQNSTFSQSTYLATSPTSSQGITLALTNCIVANVTNTLSGSFLSASGNYNGSYSSGYYPYLPITLYCTQYPFQPVGAGYYYLTNGCGFQNVGTTNIFTNLLSQLPLKTTHAPALLTNAIAAGTVIGPNINVVRDNSATLDLGYHYDPLDYCTGNLYVDNDLTLTNGVAIGFYGSSGFASVPTLISSGTAKNMNELVLYPSVQEEPIPWGTRSSYNYFINNTPNTLQFSFTDISMAGLSGEYFFDDYGTACNASFNNCQFLAAKIEPSYASYQATMGFTIHSVLSNAA